MSYDLYDTIVYELLQVLIFEHPKFTNIPSIFLLGPPFYSFLSFAHFDFSFLSFS